MRSSGNFKNEKNTKIPHCGIPNMTEEAKHQDYKGRRNSFSNIITQA